MNMKSRKFWLAIILMTIFIVAGFVGKGKSLMEVSVPIMTIFGTYIVGNVGSKIANK